jgi:hypothetical protein
MGQGVRRPWQWGHAPGHKPTRAGQAGNECTADHARHTVKKIGVGSTERIGNVLENTENVTTNGASTEVSTSAVDRPSLYKLHCVLFAGLG